MKNISVIGAGTMGNGIAHVFAMNNYSVNLIDISQEALDNALAIISKNLDRMVAKEKISKEDKNSALGNIKTFTSMSKGVSSADLVVEAATENPDIKLKIFKELSSACSDKCILASNTSSISLTKIASVCSNPERVIGMHFMNPVPVMKLVEVIKGYKTSAEVCINIMKLSRNISKVPVEVNDYPGFVANRVLMPMINEAINTLWQGVAGVEEIDTVMMLGMAHPMGPLHLADFIGLDVCKAILDVLHEGLGLSHYAPCPLLVNMVQAGNLGVKTGEGFYDYSEGPRNKKLAAQFSK